MTHNRILRSVVCFTHEIVGELGKLERRPALPRVTVLKALWKNSATLRRMKRRQGCLHRDKLYPPTCPCPCNVGGESNALLSSRMIQETVASWQRCTSIIHTLLPLKYIVTTCIMHYCTGVLEVLMRPGTISPLAKASLTSPLPQPHPQPH